MTDPVPLMDSKRRSRMVALFLIAITVGFVVHWAGYRLISHDREELSRFNVPHRRLSRAGWSAYIERKRKLQDNGGLNDKDIDQPMNGYLQGAKGRKEEADVLVPEVVHWKSFRKQVRLGYDNRTRWRPQFDRPKERRGRIREHWEMERRRRLEMERGSRFQMKSEDEREKQEEGIQKTMKTSVEGKEEETETASSSPNDNRVEGENRRGEINPTEGMRWIKSTVVSSFLKERLSEVPDPAPAEVPPPSSLDGDKDTESTSKLSSSNEDDTKNEGATSKSTSKITDVDEIKITQKKVQLELTEEPSQKIWRSTEPVIPSTSELRSSTQATSSKDELNRMMSSLQNEASEKPKEASTISSSSGEDLSSRLASNSQKAKQISKRPKSSDEVEVESSSSNLEAILGSNSSQANSIPEIRLLSKPTFSWLMNNESICKLDGSSKDNRLLAILVLSTRHAYGFRQAIRHSWGSLKEYKNWQIRTVFLLGDAPSPQDEGTLSKKLQKEQDEHGDLIMGNFNDTPQNLTIKHLMGLKWILEFCKNVNFMMKVDDNIFLNTMTFIDARNTEIEQASSSKLGFPRPADLYCRLRKNVKPDEDPAEYEKWLEKMYPDFCHRWAYGASLPAIRKLYSVSGKVGIKSKIWTDDVFVTGILRKAAFKEYNWLPKIAIITDYTSLDSVEAGYGQQMAFIRDLCRNGEWSKHWPVNAVTYLKKEEEDQGKVLEMDMRCIWGKVLFDRKGRNETKSINV